jgi:hypothetical protein
LHHYSAWNLKENKGSRTQQLLTSESLMREPLNIDSNDGNMPKVKSAALIVTKKWRKNIEQQSRNKIGQSTENTILYYLKNPITPRGQHMT